jgi:hypothetical protein
LLISFRLRLPTLQALVGNSIIDVRSHSNPGSALMEITDIKATMLEIP